MAALEEERLALHGKQEQLVCLRDGDDDLTLTERAVALGLGGSGLDRGFKIHVERFGCRRFGCFGCFRGGLVLLLATPEQLGRLLWDQPAGASSSRRSARAWASSSRRLITRLTESSPTVTP